MTFIRTLLQLHPLTLLAAFLPPILVRLVFWVSSNFNPAFPTHSLFCSASFKDLHNVAEYPCFVLIAPAIVQQLIQKPHGS